MPGLSLLLIAWRLRELQGDQEYYFAQLDANQAIHRLRKESESGLLADSVYSRQVLEAAEAYKDVLVSIFIPPDVRCRLLCLVPAN